METCAMCRNQFQLDEDESDFYTIDGKPICRTCANQIDTLLGSDKAEAVHQAINYIYTCQQQASDANVETYLKELLDNNAIAIDEIIEKQAKQHKEQHRHQTTDSPVQFDKDIDYFQDKRNSKPSIEQSDSVGKTNGLQIAGFVVSLISLFVFGYRGLSGLIGVILSFIGCLQAEKVGGKTGLGTAGIVIGIISAIGGFCAGQYYDDLLRSILH